MRICKKCYRSLLREEKKFCPACKASLSYKIKIKAMVGVVIGAVCLIIFGMGS